VRKVSISHHWRRQLWGTGARTPSTSNCLIVQVTSEPQELLTLDSLWLSTQTKYQNVTVYCMNVIIKQ